MVSGIRDFGIGGCRRVRPTYLSTSQEAAHPQNTCHPSSNDDPNKSSLQTTIGEDDERPGI